MSDISDAQILQALKDKAKLYARLASDFEKALSGSAPVKAAPVKVTLEALQEFLKEKSARPAVLVKHFGSTEKEISELVNQPNSGIKTVERGWLKLEDNSAG